MIIVKLRTNFGETIGRKSDPTNISQGFVDYPSNPDSNSQPDIDIFGRESEMRGRIPEIQISVTM